MGLLFAGMTISGFVFLLMSKPVIGWLLTNWKQALITLLLILVGVALTAVAQISVLSLGATVPLSIAPEELQAVYLAESVISETYFYFGLTAFFATRFHPLAGLPVAPGLSFFMHQFIYGAMPLYIWAVVASFAVQSLFFMITGRLTVPLGVHTVVNFR